MEQAGRDAASDLIKRIADPVLELLLSGYDPSAEDTQARAAAACDDDKWERMVEFTERGLEIRQVSLDQSTLVALAGGLSARSARSARSLPRRSTVDPELVVADAPRKRQRACARDCRIRRHRSTTLPGRCAPERGREDLGQIPGPRETGAEPGRRGVGRGYAARGRVETCEEIAKKSSFTEQSVVSVQEQQEAVKSEHMRVASEYGPISRLIDGVEIEV